MHLYDSLTVFWYRRLSHKSDGGGATTAVRGKNSDCAWQRQRRAQDTSERASMEEEDAEQRITYLLQEIDANICAAHRSATQICGTVRRHHQILRQIHEASQVWRPLFASFTQQSAGRRATRTPGGTDARTKATPGSTASGFYSVSASAVQGEGEDPSVVGSERTFRTTTLQRLAPGSAARGDGDDSTDSSLLSEPEPRLSRTPLLPKAGSRSRRKVQDTASSSVSDARTNWSTPAMSSPLRMGVLTVMRWFYGAFR